MMRKYRVLLLTSILGIGGTELSTLAIYQELSRRGHDVHWFSGDGPLADELRKADVKLHIGNLQYRFSPRIFKGVCELHRYVRENEIDLIHSQTIVPTFMSYMASRYSRECPVPVIWHDRGIKDIIYHIVGKLFNIFPDFVITNSHYERGLLEKRGLSPSKVKTVHNCMYLPLSEQTPNGDLVMRKYNLAEGVPKIGVIGRLAIQKGHRYLLDAVPRILQKHPEAVFFIVGDGPIKEDLMAQTDSLGINKNVFFTGTLRGQQLVDIYSASDIIAVPSVVEPFGNISLEAMAMSKPVVASSVGGIPEAVTDGETGILVPPADPEKLADGITYLIENRETALTMGQAGKNRVESYFTARRLVDEIEEIYHKVLPTG
jgi:glycosyltransferase involved in cell wall biosynthesis